MVTLALLMMLAQNAGNYACGYPPYPPYGCKVGACVCDERGDNCEWQMVCN